MLNVIIAYGITTRRVLDIGEFLRRGLAALMAILYLTILYLAAWRFSQWMLSALVTDLPEVAPYVIASIIVAFSMVPSFNWINRMTGHLVAQKSGGELREAFLEVQRILRTVAPTPDLLRQSGAILQRATQTARAEIYLADEREMVCQYPMDPGMDSPPLPLNDPLALALAGRATPLVLYDIERRPTARLVEAGHQMRQRGAVLALGLIAHNEFRGVVLLGPKTSGHIYSRLELDALQLLCNHLAVSIENARLYTKIQDQSRYLDNLLEHLVCGVIAVDEIGIVTVCNREARRIAAWNSDETRGLSFSALPPPLDDLLAKTLMNRHGLWDQDLMLQRADAEAIPIRVGTSLFHGRNGQMLGALLVFNDLRAIKELEAQARRSDRLAGVGTLAAGMAHEIKNPLVTIKTYAQLLPERFDDPEFRESCSTLLGREVERIDSLVNQLLRFTRPRKPNLVPLKLHDLLQNSLRLLTQPARQKGLSIETRFAAGSDLILGNSDLLTQMFLNFYFNAFDAMATGGTLFVETADAFCRTPERDLWGEPLRKRAVSVSIRDTGRGIAPENQSRVFDPFFTTKAEGTGLGLSVAHGILRDHQGSVDLRSEIDKGTTFVLIFPLSGPSESAGT